MVGISRYRYSESSRELRGATLWLFSVIFRIKNAEWSCRHDDVICSAPRYWEAPSTSWRHAWNGGKGWGNYPKIAQVFRWVLSFNTDPELVGGLEHEFYDFPSIGNFIIPTVTHSIIFQRGRLNHQPDEYLSVKLRYQEHPQVPILYHLLSQYLP